MWCRPQDSREPLGRQQQVAFGSPSCQVPGSHGQNGSGDAGVGHQEACCYGRQQEARQINGSHACSGSSKAALLGTSDDTNSLLALAAYYSLWLRECLQAVL